MESPDPTPTSAPARSRRPLFVVLSVVAGALVVLGGIAALALGFRGELRVALDLETLGGDDFAAASLAADRLTAAGPAAWPALREALRGPAPRRERALAILEKADADADALDGVAASLLLDIRAASVATEAPDPLGIDPRASASAIAMAEDVRAGAALVDGLASSDGDLVDACAAGVRRRQMHGRALPSTTLPALRAALTRTGSTVVVATLSDLGQEQADLDVLGALIGGNTDEWVLVNAIPAYAKVALRAFPEPGAERAATAEALRAIAEGGDGQVATTAADAIRALEGP